MIIINEDQIYAIARIGRRGFVVNEMHPAESNDQVLTITFADVESGGRHKVDIDSDGSIWPVLDSPDESR